MSIWGVSGSDFQKAGSNLAVAGAVFSASAALSWIVKRVAQSTCAIFKINTSANVVKAIQWTSAAAGIGAAVFINSKLSNSRFAIIGEPALHKVLKVGAVEVIVGLFADGSLHLETPICTFFAIFTAAVSLCTRYSLISVGAWGAIVGTTVLPDRPPA